MSSISFMTLNLRLQNYVHEKARTIDSYVFVDIHFVFTTCRKNEFSSATKTGYWDCSRPNALGLFVSLL